MDSEDLLTRINELAAKKKSQALSPKEEKERKDLHQAYLKAFRSGMRQHIEGMKVLDYEGRDVTPDKLKKIQKDKGLHNRHLEN